MNIVHKQARVGEAGVAALEAVHGTDYIFGSVTNVLCKSVDLIKASNRWNLSFR
jgi:hypothetical protein